jgi:hypothetical protein
MLAFSNARRDEYLQRMFDLVVVPCNQRVLATDVPSLSPSGMMVT